MSGVLNGVQNATGMPAISAARSIIYRPDSGLPFQLFFDTLNKDIYVDQSNGWELFTSGPGKYEFDRGLTLLGSTVTNNLTTGKIGGQTIIGTPNDEDGILLTLKAQNGAPTGQDNVAIRFYSDDAGTDTYYFQSFGAWNFGGNSNPLLTTPYHYVFQNRGVFNARWDFNANIALLSTTGSHIQSAWQTTAPTGNANQTHLFFDSVGNPSFRIGTNNWFKFEPASLTATRTYTLQDSSYTLAGLNIAQTFSALQTFSSGATFGAAINATAGSAANASINFGTANTGIYNDGFYRFSFAGTPVLSINNAGAVFVQNTSYFTFGNRSKILCSADGNIHLQNNANNDFSSLTFQTGASTIIGIYNGTGSPETIVTARIGSLYLRRDGGANTTLYVKESGTGNTGWVAK